MAYGFKTGGKNWPKGVSGNPRGRGLDSDLVEARKQNKAALDRILMKHLALPRNELMKLMKDPETPNMELLIATILSKAIATGDYTRANFLFERAFGKVPDEHNFTGSVHAALVQAMKGIGEPTE